MDTLAISLDDKEKQVPNLNLSYKVHRFERAVKKNDTSDALLKEIMEEIEADNMASFYESFCSKNSIDIKAELADKMKEENTKQLEALEAKMVGAVANAGDMEVLDCMFEKARFFSTIGNWESALLSLDAIVTKDKMTTSKKIDAMMERARVMLFTMDLPALKECIAETKRLVELGGDWDRRNRLKIYEALYLMAMRDLKGASVLLLDCVETFSCVECCSYQEFIIYAIITNILVLSRTDIQKKLIKNPQVISMLRDLPQLKSFLHAIYDCEYEVYLTMLLEVQPLHVMNDKYLGIHLVYLGREYRVLAYAQYLTSYRSVLVSSMANSFGMPATLLDQELSRFIASNRLMAKIDKVNGVIETRLPDEKNHQYNEVLRRGDAVLNQLQKLSRVLEV